MPTRRSLAKRLACMGVFVGALLSGLAAFSANAQQSPPGVNPGNPIQPRVVIDGVDVSEGVYREPVPDMAPFMVPNYRDKARDVVNRLVDYAHTRDPNFPVLVRGGELLAVQSQREEDLATIKMPQGGSPSRAGVFPAGTVYDLYTRNIAGVVMDQHYCEPTFPTVSREGISVLQRREVAVLSLERCQDIEAGDKAYQQAANDSVLIDVNISSELAFRTVPPPSIANVNIHDVRSLRHARNLLVVLDSWGYDTIDDWVEAIAATNHDVIIVDPFFKGHQAMTRKHVDRIKHKALGPRRMVFARLSVGLAYDTMPYWQPGWQVGSPSYLVGHFPGRTGVYWTDIMNPEWLALIGGGFASIMDLGFDGIMLDGMTTFLRQEALNPI